MGKITEFTINIHGNRQVFYPGEQIAGEVILNSYSPVEMKGIFIECQGKAECHWTEQTGSGDDRRTEHYRGEEKMFEYKVALFGGAHKQIHPQGRYSYPFAFNLPQNLPSSFEGSHGHIRYQMKAQVDKPWKKDHKVKRPFSVNELIDINLPQYQQGPGGQVHKEVGCLCCLAGPLDITANIDRAGYCPGEVILVNANVQNHTSRDMNALKAKLYKTIRYRSTRKTKTETKVVTRIDGPRIPKTEFALWEHQPFGIPATPPSIGSRIIEVAYHVEVQVDVPWGMDPTVKMPITMGTVPFQRTYVAQQNYTFTPEQTGLQANIAAAPPPPSSVFGYPDMAPPSYASAVGDTAVDLSEDGKMYGNSSYVPVYTFAQPFAGEIPAYAPPQQGLPPPNSAMNPAPYPSGPQPPMNAPPPGGNYPPPGQQYPPPGQQYPPPSQQYPPPGQQYPPPGQQQQPYAPGTMAAPPYPTGEPVMNEKPPYPQ